MKHAMKRAFSFLLCLILCLSLLPPVTLAAEPETEEETLEDSVPASPETEEAIDGAFTDPGAVDVPPTEAPADDPVLTDGMSDAPENGESADEPAEEDGAPSPEEPEEGEDVPALLTEEEASEDPEILPVRVSFVCDPAETVITVYDPARTDEAGEPRPLDAEEDGSFLLLPGAYLFDAVCEGYHPIEKKAFTVSGEAMSIEVILTGEEERETEALALDEIDGKESAADTQSFEATEGEADVGELEFVDDPSTDADSLFAAYAQRILNPRPLLRAGNTAGRKLTGTPRQGYDALKPMIIQVAAGERESTRFAVPVSSLALSKSSWTAAELGGAFVDASGNLTASALQTIRDSLNSQLELRKTVNALLGDCAYELYWFDKSSSGGFGFSFVYSINPTSVEVTGVTYVLCAAKEFSKTGAAGTFAVNTALGASVQTAKQNAQDIVARYAAVSDYDKLVGYGREICALVEYNHAATNGTTAYGNPWQLIWVFDGNSSTNVVCEGYAKAFQYLCELSSFDSSTVSSLLAEGTLSQDGSEVGGHMWNVVRLDNGSNYLVDLTNSDGSSPAVPGALFLGGCTRGSVQSGYEFSAFGSVFGYEYDSEIIDLYGEEDLTIVSSRTETASGSFGAQGDNLSWKLYDDGELVITGNGDMGDFYLTNPPWSDHADDIRMVSFEGEVSGIGACAFASCENLESVLLPSGTFIGESAFSGCSALTMIELPQTLTTVSKNAFNGCGSLEYVLFDGTEGGRAAISIADGNSALSQTTWLYLGASDGVLASGFCGVPLEKIAWTLDDEGVLSLTGSGEMCAFSSADAYPWHLFRSAITELKLSDGITSLGAYAFASCPQLEKVTIPASVAAIASTAFNSDTLLTTAGPIGGGYHFEFGWTTQIPDGAFMDMTKLQSVVIPEGITLIGSDAFSRCSALAEVQFPSTLLEIGDRAFFSANRIVEPLLPQGLTSIGKSAFYGCWSLARVQLPSSLTSIGESAFSNCDRLTDVVIEDGITTISKDLFRECDALASVTIPASVTRIDTSAFMDCPSLADVYYGAEEENWDAIDIRANNTGLDNATIHFTAAILNVIFDANGGSFFTGEGTESATETQHIEKGKTLTGYSNPAAPAEGLAFEGWYLSADAAGEPFDVFNTPITEDIRLYAKWVAGYTVVFLANGGSFWSDPSVTEYRDIVVPGAAISWGPSGAITEKNLICTGETWYLDPECTGEGVTLGEYIPTGDVTLYAYWEPGYEIVLDSNGVNTPRWGGQMCWYVRARSSLDLNGLNLDFECDRTIEGWYYNDACTQSTGDASNFVPTKNVTLYAKWTDGFYVNFDANGGYVEDKDGVRYSLKEDKLASGEKIRLTAKNDDYTLDFAGWALSSAPDVVKYRSGDTISAANNSTVDLVAVWKTNARKSFVKSSFELLLGREPTASELSSWTSRLSGGTTAATMISTLCKSSEFTARGLNFRQVVEGLSELMCSGNPDGGIDAWVDTLSKGVSCDYIIRAFSSMGVYKTLCANSYNVTPGTVSLTENRDRNINVTAFVQRCYQIMMSRNGDAGGLNAWTGALLGKVKTGASLVASFLLSNEFQSKGLDTDTIVEILYNVMLNRASDPGKVGWVSAVEVDQASLVYVINGFSGSQEFTKLCQSYGILPGRIEQMEPRDRNINVTRFVNRCYSEALGRRADVGGLNIWCNAILTKQKTPQQVAAGFVFSNECLNMNLSNEEFVRMLYRLYMGRTADAGGLNNWVRVLESGMSRQDAVTRFARSKEFSDIVASYHL